MSGPTLRKPVTQTRLHDPENGVRGNCVAACLASVTGAPIETFDHIINAYDWWSAFEESCKEYGFSPLRMPVDDERPVILPGVHFGSGLSERGFRHMCVYSNGTLIHDPHPSRAGLVEVDMWTLLVPLPQPTNHPPE